MLNQGCLFQRLGYDPHESHKCLNEHDFDRAEMCRNNAV